MQAGKILFLIVICIVAAYFIRSLFATPRYTLTVLAILAFFAGAGTSVWGCIHEDTTRLAFGATMLGFSGLCFIAAAIRDRGDPSAAKKDTAPPDTPIERYRPFRLLVAGGDAC
jgi:hypothetical protein